MVTNLERKMVWFVRFNFNTWKMTIEEKDDKSGMNGVITRIIFCNLSIIIILFEGVMEIRKKTFGGLL